MTRPTARRAFPTAEAGFSLLEVMIAGVILILVFWGLMQFAVRGRTQVDFEEDRRKATAVGQQRIEEARRWTYAYLEALDGTAVDTAMTVDGQDYTVSLAVNPDDEPPPANDDISVVKVGVIWDRRTLDSGTVVPDTLWLTTLVGRRYP
jgi:type II secretory pathway pseudopilin PulG